MNTPQKKRVPDPIATVAREGKGCKQYTFDTIEELTAWVQRKPYRNEQLIVLPRYRRRFLSRMLMPAIDAPEYVAKVVGEARRFDEVSTSLAATVLKQADEAEGQAAFWFISALSKLTSARPTMTIDEVLAFAADAMPAATREWGRYVQEKGFMP